MKVASVSYRDPEAKFKFTESLRKTGFGVLTDHPIPSQLVDAVFADWREFFAGDDKHRYTFDPAMQSGYFPFRTENAKDSKVKDLKEFYHLHAWGKLPEGMNARTWDLYNQMSAVASELLSWIEEATPSDIRSRFSMPLPQMIEGSRETLLRPIHYPPLKGDEEKGAIRAAAHEDINLITLLPAATAPGLQVRDTAGNWHDVPCDPGSLVINAGDMLQMASEGYFISTTHQVVNPDDESQRGKPRYSMPLFLHPRTDVALSPKHTAGSYLQERLEEIGLKKKAQAK